MQFAHDTEVALEGAAALVNTNHDGVERLTDPVALAAFLDEHRYSGTRAGDQAEVLSIRELRTRVAALWDTGDVDQVVGIVNQILADAHALPQLIRHDGWDWHLHLTPRDAPLVDRVGTEIAMAVADLIRATDLERLKRCDGEDCEAVFVDLSRNRSRRFCDLGNCANRAHVAAYRARKAARGV
ncbi:MAG TPA: CGNR zinc finger domain-containing protein [Egicoccus sp.]|nr:CGNR zinc finger domain-containing protein [Egicoccus sp.]HSK22670.1 CGNR zinc finger domain-containing protein [Egicoccus sp.]